jgi:hypothetical protein
VEVERFDSRREELRTVMESNELRYNEDLEMLVRGNHLGNTGERLLEANGFTDLRWGWKKNVKNW